MIGLTHEALKTKPQMRRKVHQVKEGREVLEKLQEFSEENGKDDTASGEISQQGLTDWTQQYNYNRAQRLWRQHSSELPKDELL